jgi:hypothetical protein
MPYAPSPIRGFLLLSATLPYAQAISPAPSVYRSDEFVERPTGLSICHPQVIGGNRPRCGDSVLEPPEVCDRNLLNGHTCVTEGFTDGVLACGADCGSFDTSGCF